MKSSLQNKYQICILSDMLANGGAEKSAALLSIFFEENNCNVHHIIVQDLIEYQYAGKVLNLGKLKQSEGFNLFDRIFRLWSLIRFFRNNKFDYIIDNRVKRNFIQEFIIAKFIFNAPSIAVIHSFMLNLYFPKNTYLASNFYNHFYKTIAVSNQIEQQVKASFKYSNTQTIHNPLDYITIEKDSLEEIKYNFKYILAVGRMNDNVKQFDKLMDCYAKSVLPKNDIKLVILGDGILKNNYIAFANKLNLEDKIIFEGKVSNPYKYYKNALFTILCSKNEGFPNVLIESLACETPIIAFDCKSGPSEIIINNKNGILVENQNFEALKNAIDILYTNKNFYLHCKENSKATVERYAIKNIGNQWLQMMNII